MEKTLIQIQLKGTCDHCGGHLWVQYYKPFKSGILTFFCRKGNRKDILHKMESPERRFAEFLGITWYLNKNNTPKL